MGKTNEQPAERPLPVQGAIEQITSGAVFSYTADDAPMVPLMVHMALTAERAPQDDDTATAPTLTLNVTIPHNCNPGKLFVDVEGGVIIDLRMHSDGPTFDPDSGAGWEVDINISADSELQTYTTHAVFFSPYSDNLQEVVMNGAMSDALVTLEMS